jgi:hypothetical protein
VRNETLIQRRVNDLVAWMREQHDGLEDPFLVSIACDGCGSVRLLPADLPKTWDLFLAGWKLSSVRPYHDLCPGCA